MPMRPKSLQSGVSDIGLGSLGGATSFPKIQKLQKIIKLLSSTQGSKLGVNLGGYG